MIKLFKKISLTLFLVALLSSTNLLAQWNTIQLVDFSIGNRWIDNDGNYAFEIVATITPGYSWYVGGNVISVGYNGDALAGTWGISEVVYNPTSLLPGYQWDIDMTYADYGLNALAVAILPPLSGLLPLSGTVVLCTLKLEILDETGYDNLEWREDLEEYGGWAIWGGTNPNNNQQFLNCTMQLFNYCYHLSDISPQQINPPSCTPPAVPTGVQVTNITTNTATLSWNYAANVYWQFRYGTSSNLDGAGIYEVYTNQYSFFNLSPNTTYYYQVRALIDNNCYSDWTSVGSFTTSVECVPPDPPTELYVTSIGTTTALIYWTPPSGEIAGYYYQYTTNPDNFAQENTYYTTNTYVNLSGLSPSTTYYWRVKSARICNNQELTSNWANGQTFETWYECLTPPTLTGLSTIYVGTYDAVVGWNSITPPVGHDNLLYHYQITTDPDVWGELIYNTTNNFAEFLDLNPETTYYWRVKASWACMNGIYFGEWAYGSFQTEGIPCTPPDPPTGLYYTDLTSTSVQIGCNFEDGVFWQFAYQIDGSNGWNYVYSEFEFLFLENLQPNTTYNWKVQALSDFNCASDWVYGESFTTPPLGYPPAAPEIISPIGVGIYPSYVTLYWSGVEGANYYEVSFNGADPIPTMQTQYYIGYLDWNTEYMWMVRAVNEFGASDWTTAEFTTMLEAPTGLTPNNEFSMDAVLSWDPVDGADWYVGWISDGYNTWYFTTDEPLYTFLDAEYNTVYYWAVAAHNLNGNFSPQSLIASFTTILQPVELIYPVDEVDVPYNPTLEWTASPGADYYIVIVQRVADEELIVEEYEWLGTTYDLTGLEPLTEYRWFVAPRTYAGNFSFISEASFTTTLILEPPTLLAPENEAVTDLWVNFDWTDVEYAGGYVIEISPDPNFQIMVFADISNVSAYSKLVPYYNTQMFWRVKAYYYNYESDYSDVYSFTTLNVPNVELVAPQNESETGRYVNFSWSAVPFCDYEWEVMGVNVDYYDNAILQNNAYNYPYPFDYFATYMWRVRPVYYSIFGFAEYGEWTDWWTFNIEPIPAPQLVSPFDNANYSTEVSILFNWTDVEGADSYNFYIASDYDFTEIVFSTTTTISQYLLPANSLPGGEYYWAVTSNYLDYESIPSDIWSFTLTQELPLEVSLQNRTICASQLSVNLGPPTILNGSGQYSYVWSLPTGTGALNNRYVANPILSRPPISNPFSTQQFTLTVTDLVRGQVATATMWLYVTPGPSVQLVSPAFQRRARNATWGVNLNTKIQSITGGTPFANPPYYNWQWFDNSDVPVANPTDVRPTTTGLIRYYVIAQDANSCPSAPQNFYIFSYGSLREGIYEFDNPDVTEGIAGLLYTYPTPATNVLYVQAPFFDKTDMELIVVNSLGQEVKRLQRTQVEFFEEQLDISDLPAGTYFIVVRTDIDQLVRRFIKY